MIATRFNEMKKKFFGSLSLNIVLKVKSVLILIFIYPFFDETQIGVYAVGLSISGLLSPILLLNLMDGSNKFFLKNINYAKKLKIAIKQYV
jgi:O-antigen/teichoic acid export membrane protein